MAKRKGDQPNSESQGPADNRSDKVTAQPSQGEPSPADVARIESPDLVPPQGEQAAPRPAIATPIQEPAPAVMAVVPPTASPASPQPAITAPDDVRSGPADASSETATPKLTWARARRLTPLAASIAIAAAVGAMAGSMATTGLGRLWPGEPPARAASTDYSRVLTDSIARINADVTALKAAVETSGRSANSQLVKLGDRLDRFERAQLEPAAKLAKLAEAIDRIEHRAPAMATPALRDTTGSTAALAPPHQPQAAPVRDTDPPVLEGWVVRSVYNGAALIQGRLGVVEVERGDTLPGLGRIESIRRQDGRWVVVTSKGLITAR